MSDDTDYVSEAESLISTYNAISSPTLDDVNTLTTGISSILNNTDLTIDDAVTIISDLSAVLESSSYTSSDYTFVEIDSSKLTTDINTKFLSVIMSIFSEAEGTYPSIVSDAITEIGPYASSTSTLSSADYETLWTNLNNTLSSAGVSDTDLSTMETQYYAVLKIYSDLNYSNLMTKLLEEDTVSTYLIGTFIPSLLSSYSGSLNITTLSDTILTLFSNAGLSETGMTTLQFISASQQTLAYLSTYLTDTDISFVKALLEDYITGTFFLATSYDSSMYLSSATTLTSSDSVYFSIGALPLTPPQAITLTGLISFMINIYPFSDSDKIAIIDQINEYVDTIDYKTYGFSTTQTGEIWTTIEDAITSYITDTDGIDSDTWITYFKSFYTNALSSLVYKNAYDALQSSAYYDTVVIQSVLEVTNPITGVTDNIGNYLTDWFTAFTDNISPDLGEINTALLKLALPDLLKANNNVATSGADVVLTYQISGYNFMQICISILEYISNFLTQTQVDTVAQDLMTFFITAVASSDLLTEVEDDAQIASLIATAVILIIGSVVTAGAAAAAATPALTAEAAAEAAATYLSMLSDIAESLPEDALDFSEEASSIASDSEESVDTLETVDLDTISTDDSDEGDMETALEMASEAAENASSLAESLRSVARSMLNLAITIGVISFVGLAGLANGAYNISQNFDDSDN